MIWKIEDLYVKMLHKMLVTQDFIQTMLKTFYLQDFNMNKKKSRYHKSIEDKVTLVEMLLPSPGKISHHFMHTVFITSADVEIR